MKVKDLQPGDVFEMPFREGEHLATYVGGGPHPKYRGMALVIWVMHNGTMSYDALAYDQELYHGKLVNMTKEHRLANWGRVTNNNVYHG